MPDAKGYTALVRYLLGITDEERQRTRDQILNTSQDDFRRFGEVLESVRQHGAVVALAAPQVFENSRLAGQFALVKVL
ncbi:MAG: hypothetical protein N2646_08580 [Bellilinea sp.]|nr:hypothetical protein [Bellilinea sp.]